jgi:hypothetical protein
MLSKNSGTLKNITVVPLHFIKVIEDNIYGIAMLN